MLAKTVPELISRLNSYTLEELIEDLVLDNGKPTDVTPYTWVMYGSLYDFHDNSVVAGNGFLWDYRVVGQKLEEMK